MNNEQVIHALGIDDAYHVERVLASGPGGVTELVSMDGSGPFVRKRIPSKLARRGVWAALADCGCARLPRVEATYEMPDEFVVVCDYVPGESLEELVGSRGAFAEKDAVSAALQICEAVGALHERGIIHRDISPTNVIVAADGAHLIDFGIARFRVEGATRDTTQLGTYGFASPEQYGFAQTDARSDVYSIARVLGYLLTGVSPADAEKYEAALADAARVRPELAAVVRRASSMEPSARYQSAGELARALRGEDVTVGDSRATGGSRGETVPPPSPAAPLGHERARRPINWLKVLFAVMAVAAFAAAVAVVLSRAGVIGGAEEKDAPTAEGATAPEAPTGNEPQVDTTVLSVDNPLEIVDSGWSVDRQGYVHYGIALRNNGDAAIEFPSYTVTGRDESGAVVFSQEQVLSGVGAGETIWWGDLAGGGDRAPSEVDFTVNAVSDYQVMSAPEASAAFAIDSAQPVTDSLGGLCFVGELSCERDDGTGLIGQVAVVCILRDESGAIVFGTVDFTTRPAVGESTSFEVSALGAPDYATYELYAVPW